MNISRIQWLDQRGWVKPPLFLYFILAFLARGWCVFIMSLTQMNDRAQLVRILYPLKESFILALLSGLGAVLLYGVILGERKRTLIWLRPIFRRMKWALWLLILLDGSLLLYGLERSGFMFSWGLALNAIALFWCGLYLYQSNWLRHYLMDW